MSAADLLTESDSRRGGAPPRHVDVTTARLDMLARSWLDVQQTRKALAQRELDEKLVASFLTGEEQLGRALTKALRTHALWPWLSQFPGLGGVHVALVVGRIGDPRRFPGQRCSEGHYLPPLYAVGSPCPVADCRREDVVHDGDGAESPGADESLAASESTSVCPGTMLAPRPGTGTRSVWHWAGLIPGARRRKGVQATFEPRVKTSFRQPGGICEQIVRLRVPHYRDVYDDAKTRLSLRLVEVPPEGEVGCGAGLVDTRHALEVTGGELRQYQVDDIARLIAGKAFLGDLLAEWKRLVALDEPPEIAHFVGGDQ